MHSDPDPTEYPPAPLEVAWVEYQQIIAATERQFDNEEHDIEARQVTVEVPNASHPVHRT